MNKKKKIVYAIGIATGMVTASFASSLVPPEAVEDEPLTNPYKYVAPPVVYSSEQISSKEANRMLAEQERKEKEEIEMRKKREEEAKKAETYKGDEGPKDYSVQEGSGNYSVQEKPRDYLEEERLERLKKEKLERERLEKKRRIEYEKQKKIEKERLEKKKEVLFNVYKRKLERLGKEVGKDLVEKEIKKIEKAKEKGLNEMRKATWESFKRVIAVYNKKKALIKQQPKPKPVLIIKPRPVSVYYTLSYKVKRVISKKVDEKIKNINDVNKLQKVLDKIKVLDQRIRNKLNNLDDNSPLKRKLKVKRAVLYAIKTEVEKKITKLQSDGEADELLDNLFN